MAELVSIKRNVDVSPGQAAPAVFHCSQGDVGSKIILGLLNNGTAYTIPSGVTVTIEGSESNGSIFTPISATASGSDITFYLTGEMTAVAGPAICQAVLKSGSNILGTANFTLEVESSPMGADAPPVFTDAGWTWMLQKLTTEIVPALGDDVISAIESKADQTDLTALSNTVAGHTGSITVLNNTVNTLNQGVTENRQNIARKLEKNQGTANAGKYLKVGTDGNVTAEDLDVTTDKTLSIADKAADAKAVGDELTDLKADLSEMDETLFSMNELDLSKYTAIKYAINLSNNWSSAGYSKFIPVEDLAKPELIVTGNSVNGSVISPLKTDDTTNPPQYATGMKRTFVPAGETVTFNLPADCKCVNVLTTWDNDFVPESILVYEFKLEKIKERFEEVIDNRLIDGKIVSFDSIRLNSYPTIQAAVASNNNKWSSNGSSIFIPRSVIIGDTISIESNEANGSVIRFLKNDNHVSDTLANYATGTTRTFVPAGEIREFEIPSDCEYINVLNYWGNDFIPKSVKAYTYTNNFADFMDDVMLEDQTGLTWSSWYNGFCILANFYNPKSPYELQQGIITSASSILKASSFIPVRGKMLELPMIWVSGSTYANYGISLYDKDKNPIPGRAIGAMSLHGENDPRYVWTHVYLPENAKYFRTTYWSDTSQAITEGYAPPFTYNLLKEIPEEYKPITHELPVDTWMQNAIRRARQLTDIKWTPRVNIPRYSMMNGSDIHFLDWFYADHEYTGIPYSGAGKREYSASGWTAPEEWGYAHNWVGGCIPFEAFVTAARYPNSIFSETVNQASPDYDSSPFGIVCTGLVNYTVNGPWPLRGIRNFFNTSDRVFRAPDATNTIAEIDANDIMIGDFLYTAPHVIVITDLLRDADGNVTHVEMSEATTVGNGNNAILGGKLGGVARRKMWEYQTFKRTYGAYIKYRRTTFYGIPYTPSIYVDTGNEGDRKTIVDLPCIPYLGNGAIYRVGYIHNSKILIGATGFTSLVVTKDGEDFGTFDVTGLTEIEVGFSEVGTYEAYLTNGTSRTMACTWTVAEGTM